MEPFFSVIIPTYNSAKIIISCLSSVIEQTYTQLEILIMDGLSDDNTLELIASLNDPRIKIYSKADKGIYDAMNKGIYKAAGKWLFFMGSDDVLFSEKVLANIYTSIINSDVDIIYGNVISDRFDGLYAGEFNRQKILDMNICHQSIFYKKAVFRETGIYNTAYLLNADWDHNLKWFFSKKLKNKFVNITVSKYADGGLSSTTVDAKFDSEWGIRYIIYGKTKLSLVKKIGVINYFLKEATKKQNNVGLRFLLSNLLRILVS